MEKIEIIRSLGVTAPNDQDKFVRPELMDNSFGHKGEFSNNDQFNYLKIMQNGPPRLSITPEDVTAKNNALIVKLSQELMATREELVNTRKEVETFQRQAKYWQTQYNDGIKDKTMSTELQLDDKRMKEILKSKDTEKLTEEEYEFVTRRTNNQAFSKEVMANCRSYQRSLIDNNPHKYYGSNPGLLAHVEAELGAGSSCRYQCYTINFKSEVEHNIVAIKQAIMAACTRKWVKRYMYCIEQRGTLHPDDENYGKGVHIHMLIEKKDTHTKKSISQCSTEIKTNFRGLCLVDIAGPFHYYYSTCAEENWVNYIKGIKKDESKLEKVQADIHWRKNELRMPDCIGNWDDI